MEFDAIVVGGGLVGVSVAYGLSKKGQKVAIVDEGDRAFRASRGNFGLVWVQSKGWDYPAYSQWTKKGSDLWPAFNDTLQHETGVALGYQRPGGMEFCLNEEDWNHLERRNDIIKTNMGGDFDYEMLDNAALKKRIPEVSKEVVGASFCHHDGHVNPLFLLRALHQSFDQNGGQYFPNNTVNNIESNAGEFIVHGENITVTGGKVILCSGLGNQHLGEMLDISIPVKPNRGQLLITEKVKAFLKHPTLFVRQTTDGGLQIGDSSEDVGLDDQTSNEVMSMLAARAAKVFPILKQVKVVRAWSALRVMTPDGKPVYQQSTTHPGAFGVACHSGVTLAAAHTEMISDWILGRAEDELITAFSSDRFYV